MRVRSLWRTEKTGSSCLECMSKTAKQSVTDTVVTYCTSEDAVDSDVCRAHCHSQTVLQSSSVVHLGGGNLWTRQSCGSCSDLWTDIVQQPSMLCIVLGWSIMAVHRSLQKGGSLTSLMITGPTCCQSRKCAVANPDGAVAVKTTPTLGSILKLSVYTVFACVQATKKLSTAKEQKATWKTAPQLATLLWRRYIFAIVSVCSKSVRTWKVVQKHNSKLSIAAAPAAPCKRSHLCVS